MSIVRKITGIFKGKKKMSKVIGAVVLVAAGLFFSSNEKAAALLVRFREVMNVISGNEPTTTTTGTKSTSTSTGDDIFGSPAHDYSPTNSSDLPVLSNDYSPTNKTSPTSYIPTTEYSTTNSEQKWLEIRGGYDDGDKAAEAEKRRQNW